MRIDDEIYVHGYLDEIRQNKVIVRNDGGYFGTVVDELVEAIPKDQYESRLKADMVTILEDLKLDIESKINYYEQAYIIYETDMSGRMFGCDECEELVQDKINKLKGNNE